LSASASKLTGRVLCGDSAFGPPPVALFEFPDPDRVTRLWAEIWPRRGKRLESNWMQARTGAIALTGDPFADFESVAMGLAAGLRIELSARPRQINSFDGAQQVALAAEHGDIALHIGQLAWECLFGHDWVFDEAAWSARMDALSQALAPCRVDPGARALHRAAQRHLVPVRWLDQAPFNSPEPGQQLGLLQIGHGCRQRRFWSTVPEPDDGLAWQNALLRERLVRGLLAKGLPIAGQDLEFPNKNRRARVLQAAERLGYPVLLGPIKRPALADWTPARDWIGPISHPGALEAAYEQLRDSGPMFWLQAWPGGRWYRFLVIDQTVRAIYRRATDTGQYALEPDAHQFSESIHDLAGQVALTLGLPGLCAVELAIVDPGGPAARPNCAIVDVCPDPRVCWPPGPAAAREAALAEAMIDAWLSDGDKRRIPIVAVTGTNGKTTTSRMLAAIFRQAYDHVGLATTEGCFVNDQLIDEGDQAGVGGAAEVLADRRVEAAVLETARGGIVDYGFAFDACDVAVCLNISDDHLGRKGIDTLDQLAEVKGRLLARARQAVVVNADDPLCLSMRRLASKDSRQVLVSQDPQHPEIRAHRRQGGEAVFQDGSSEEARIVLARGTEVTTLMALGEVPATMGGRLKVNCLNALHAVAVAWSFGIATDCIRRALTRFDHDHLSNPGRFNFFTGKPYTLLLDFTQNPAGVTALLDLIRPLDVPGRRLLVCTTLGARHRHHIDAVAQDLACHFDEFWLSCDPKKVQDNPEYSSPTPVDEMLKTFSVRLAAEGIAKRLLHCRHDRAEAVLAALDQARPGDLLVLMVHPEVALPILTAHPNSETRPDPA